MRDVHKRTGIAASTLGGYFSGRHRPSVDTLTALLHACGVTDPAETAAWTEALLRVRRTGRRRRQSGICPYRGLEPFRPEHHQWFFGRTALVETVIDRLAECGAAGHPVVLVGPSGSGKSSLFGAGVIPMLEQGGLRSLLLTPGRDPLGELTARLATAEDASDRPDVLVVDQFEELFAPDVSPPDRMAFVRALHEVASGPADAGRWPS